MATLPGYERGEAIGWGKESVVYEAEGDSTLVIKVTPLASASDPGLVGGRDQASFLRAVMEEKSAFSAGCTRLCEIHAFWAVGASGSVVKRRFSRSIADLIEGKVQFTPEDFHRTVESILDGLVQLKTHAGRSHGNLTASNVLIEGRGALAERKLYLTDLADSSASPNPVADLEGLGKLIYEMVRRQLVTHCDVPVTDSGDWAQTFERRAPAWLAFSNFLLDPARRGDPDPLGAAVAQFRSLGGSKSRRLLAMSFGVSRHLKWIVGGLITLGLVLMVFWRIWVHSDRYLLNDLQNFRNDYGNWFAALEVSLPANEKNWRNDIYLRDQVIDPLQQFKDLAAGSGLIQAVVTASPGEIPSTIKPKAARNEFRNLLKIVDETRASLERWTAKDDLNETYKVFNKLGWTQAMRDLESARSDIVFDQNIAGQISSTLKIAQAMSGVREQIEQLKQDAENAENYAGDGLTTLVLAELGQGDLSTLSRRIQSVRGPNGLPKISREASNKEVAYKRLRNEETLTKMAGANFSEKLTQWQQRVGSYRRIGDAEDPRSFWEEELKRGKDGSLKSDIEREIKSLPEPLVEKDRSLLETIATKIRELLRLNGVSSSPPEPTQVPGAVTDGYAKALQKLQVQMRQVTGATEATQALQIFLDETASLQLTGPGQAFRSEMEQSKGRLSSLPPMAAPPLLDGRFKPKSTSPGVVTFDIGLDFILIQPPDASQKPFYLERTEFSLAPLQRLIQAKGLTFPLQDQSLRGPATWQLVRGTLFPMTSWKKWGPNQRDPDSADKELFGWDLPANFIGPGTARQIAQALGARLPTVTEWQTAYKMANLRSENENLRDTQWFNHWKAVNKYYHDNPGGQQGKTANDADWPQRNSLDFRPPQKETSDNSVSPTDDGHAWFRSTKDGPGDKLNDMQGNVAEYVSSGASIEAIGSSALAPPNPQPDQPRPLPPGPVAGGWSDVGMRLALDPTGESTEAATELQATKDRINRETTSR